MRKNMRNNHYLYLILSILLLLMLEGCAKTPQEVKDEINKKQGLTERPINNNQELEYDTIENIFKTIDDVKAQNFDNLEFSHAFEINKPEQIGVIKFRQINNFLNHDIEKIKDFIGDSYNKKFLILDQNPTNPSAQYDDKSKQLYCGMLNNGFYSYEQNNGYGFVNKSMNGILTKIEEFSLMQEYEDKSYKLSDGAIKISDALKIAQNYANEMSEKYGDLDLIPYKLIVYKETGGNYLYQIHFAKSYKNVYFAYTYSRRSSLNYPYILVSGFSVMLALKGSPVHVVNSNGIIEYIGTEQNYNKIITFAYATKLLSNKLTSYKKHEVQYVSLENRLMLKTNTITEQTTFDTLNYSDDNIYETKPCWTFYLDITPDQGVYAMVDCITGEIEFIDNTN